MAQDFKRKGATLHFNFFSSCPLLMIIAFITTVSAIVTTEPSITTTTTPKSVHFVTMNMNLQRAITLVLVIFTFLIAPIFGIQLMAKRATRMLDLSKKLSADNRSGGNRGEGGDSKDKKPKNQKKKEEKEIVAEVISEDKKPPSTLPVVKKKAASPNENSPQLMDYGSAVEPIKKMENQ